MTNRRTARNRIMRLDGEALVHGGHLAAGLHTCVKPIIRWLNAGDILERVFRKSRARQARRNYIETGSATRWGTCKHTMWIHEPLEGEPITWSLNDHMESP